MVYQIYIDVLIFTNLFMDLVILWLTGRVFRQRIVWWRLLLGGLTGSLMTVGMQIMTGILNQKIIIICRKLGEWNQGIVVFIQKLGVSDEVLPEATLQGLIVLQSVIIIIFAGIVMVRVTYKVSSKKELLELFGGQILITMTMGGFLVWVSHLTLIRNLLKLAGTLEIYSIRQLVLLTVFCVVILMLLREGMLRFKQEQKYYEYRGILMFEHQRGCGKGFVDTGNCLLEPISHRPVVVTDADFLLPILPQEYQKLVCTYVEQGIIDFEQIEEKKLHRAKWIPYQTIDVTSGSMLGILCHQLILQEGKEYKSIRPVVIGISRTPMNLKKHYQMIIPGLLLEK